MGLIFVICFGYTSFVIAQHFWRGPTMSVSDVKKKWGDKKFDIDSFKNGTVNERSSMAYDLLKRQKEFKGKFYFKIRKLLGDYSGHYFSDMYPTYIIQEGKTHEEETWQLVFLIDRNEKIKEIIVHKNCCET